MSKKVLLREYYALCEGGVCQDLLTEAEKRDVTENNAMYPASSVSGFYFANKSAKYFPVGKMQRDQIEDYAKRKGMSEKDAEKWLAPNLAYTP